MAKEAKIGIGLILVLLITLAVVVILKFTTGDKTVALVIDKEKAAEAAKQKAGLGSEAKILPATTTSSQTAKPTSSASARPGPSWSSSSSLSNPSAATSSGSSRWSTTASGEASAAGSSTIAAPSLMPGPPPGQHDRYGHHDPFRGNPGNSAGAEPGYATAGSDYRDALRGRNSDPSGPARPGELLPPPTSRDNPYYANTSQDGLRNPALYGSSSRGGPAYSQYGDSSYGSRHYGHQQGPDGERYAGGDAAASSRYNGTSALRTVAKTGGDSGRRDDGTYKVQPNDNYWTISEKLYGTGAYFKALAELNRGKTPRQDRLQVGAIILAPSTAELEQKYRDLCPTPDHRKAVAAHTATPVSTRTGSSGRRTYVVQEGDTLYSIARTELGKASRWAEIFELNRDRLGDDYDFLTPGSELVMPGVARVESVTQRPEPTYRR